MTGLETADFLAYQGNAVTLIGRNERVGKGVYQTQINDIFRRLSSHNVVVITNVELKKNDGHYLYLRNMDNNEESVLYADYIVLSFGVKPEVYLYEQVKKHKRSFLVGDASGTGRISDAIRSGYSIAKRL